MNKLVFGLCTLVFVRSRRLIQLPKEVQRPKAKDPRPKREIGNRQSAIEN
jgi:hypothetical protein